MSAPYSHQRTCFILLPGFSPDHIPVLALKEALEKRGYAAIASSFFGDSVFENFSKLTIQQCHENISYLINSTAQKYERVIGIGISLGGALLLEHAKTNRILHGIASIGTPFRLKYRSFMRIGEIVLPFVYPLWEKFERHKTLRPVPIGAGPQVIEYLENDFLQNLEKITIPILFIHSKKDFVTDYRVLPEYLEKIGSEKKQSIISENGNHVIDHDPDMLIKHISTFFNL